MGCPQYELLVSRFFHVFVLIVICSWMIVMICLLYDANWSMLARYGEMCAVVVLIRSVFMWMIYCL